MCEKLSNNSFIIINGYPIWFEVFGSGSTPLLMISGAIGTGRTDFFEQLEGEDALDFDKFTIIAVEAPGWGRSRPPTRQYGNNHYEKDADTFHTVMGHLGYNKYSVIGWSDGARVALLMAIKYRNYIKSLVLTAIATHASEKGLKFMLSTKSIDTWSQERVDSYLRCYESKEEIQKLWTRFAKFAEYYYQYYPEDIFKNKYHLVKCPVLIFHGDRDQLIDSEQPLNVCKKIKNAKLHRFPVGGHDLHQRYATTFKRLVEEHILNNQ